MTDFEREDDLKRVFDAARATPQAPGEALMARVLGDALTVQAEMREAVEAPGGAARPGLLAGLFGALGGWPAMAGLGTAVVAGLWLGFTPAFGLGEAITTALGTTTDELYLIDYASGYDFAFAEEEAG